MQIERQNVRQGFGESEIWIEKKDQTEKDSCKETNPKGSTKKERQGECKK